MEQQHKEGGGNVGSKKSEAWVAEFEKKVAEAWRRLKNKDPAILAKIAEMRNTPVGRKARVAGEDTDVFENVFFS